MDNNPIQAAIRDINSGQPSSDPNPNPNPNPDPNPAPAAKPASTLPRAQKPANNEPAQKTTPGQGDDNKPADPPFVKKSEGQQQPATKAPANEPVSDDLVYNRLSDWTGGSITSKEAFVNLINDYNSLVEQAEKGFEPKFKDERAKWAYQVLAKAEGAELESAMKTLRTLRFNVEGKSERELLFEKYLLDPQNSDLTEANAMQYFEADYEERFSLIGKDESDLSPDQIRQKRLQERTLANSVREAKEYFNKFHTDFQAMQNEPQKISEDVVRSIGDAVNDFGGVRIAFSDNAAENELLNLAIDNPQELEDLQRDALAPNEWWNNFIGQFDLRSQEGYNAFVREFYMMKNHERVRKEAFEHGVKIGQLRLANEGRNNKDQKDVSNYRQNDAGNGGTFIDAWSNARNGR